jgi:DNA mismatch repair ATPase MutS
MLRANFQIKVVGGKHPIVEKLISENYVPNSIDMKEDFSQDERQEIEDGVESLCCPKAIILTGPNMGGKTYEQIGCLYSIVIVFVLVLSYFFLLRPLF